MRVYRTITKEEITNLYRGESICDINVVRGENTHQYQEGINYIHFFRYHESAEFYFSNNHVTQNPRIAYMVANIPNEVLRKNIGYGIYNGIKTELKELEGFPIPFPEYAIPQELFEQKYIVEVSNNIGYEYKRKDNEYSHYLEVVAILLEVYDYNHYAVARKLQEMNIEEILGVVDDDRNEDEIFHDRIKEFSKIKDDLLKGWKIRKNMI